jgi:PAS domain S-box-containing protein
MGNFGAKRKRQKLWIGFNYKLLRKFDIMTNKNWQEAIGGKAQLIIIYAIIVLSIILTLGHVLDFPHFLFKTPPIKIEWSGITMDIIVVFLIGLISIMLIRQAESKRKKVEEDLSRSATAVKMSLESIVISDIEGEIIDVNEACLKMYGAEDKKDLIGKNAFDLLMPAVRDKALADTKELLSKGFLKNREYSVITKDGNEIYLEVNTSLMKDNEGKPIGFVAVIRNITERKCAEGALRESEDKFAKAFNASPSAVFITTPKEGRFIEINKSGVNMLGYEPDNIVGRTAKELHLWADLGDRGALIHSLQTKGAVHNMEVKLCRKSGEVFDALISVDVIDIKGERCLLSTASDVTQQKRIEEKLKESEQKYRTLLETTDTGFCILDRQGSILDANREYVRLSGHSTLAEIMGRSVIEWTAEYDLERNAEEVKRCMQQGYVRNLELDYVDKHGKATPIEINATMIQSEKGERILTLCRDITERKKMEKALRKSEEEFRLITNALPVLISYVDSKQRYRFNNKAYEEWFGHRCTEFLGKHIKEFLGQPAYKSIKRYVEAVLAGQEVTFESFVPYKDGGTRYVIATYVPHFGEQGEIRGFFALVNDLTEHKKTDDALQASQEKLKNVFASIKDSITITDLKGNIVDCNQAALDLFGLSSKKEALESSILDFVAAKERSRVKTGLRDVLEQRSVKDVEYTLLRKDKKEFPGEVSSSAVKNASGEPVGFVGITKDISERKKAEEALRKSKDLNTILRISYRISQVLELDKMLKLACEETAKALEIDRCAVVLVDEKEKTVVVKAVFIKSQPHPDVLGEKIVIEDFADLNKMYGKDPKILHLPMIEKAFLSRKAKEYFKNTMMKSLLIVPIEIGKKPLGYLSVATMEKEKTFTEAEIVFVQTLANHLAIAIENAKLMEIVNQHSEDLKVLSSQVIKAQEQERKKIAGELHDEIGQLLTAMKMNIDSLGKELPSSLPSAKERIDDLREISSQSLEYVRNMTQELRPTILDDFGLVPALNWHIKNFAKRYDIEVQLKTNNFECRLPFEVETILYRIAQEGLNNIAKHSQAKNVLVLLERKNSFIFMKIKDDGIGFEVERVLDHTKPKRGLGLFSIKERVSLLKGTFNLFSKPKKGTRLEIKIPCPEKTRKEKTYGQNKDSIS